MDANIAKIIMRWVMVLVVMVLVVILSSSLNDSGLTCKCNAIEYDILEHTLERWICVVVGFGMQFSLSLYPSYRQSHQQRKCSPLSYILLG